MKYFLLFSQIIFLIILYPLQQLYVVLLILMVIIFQLLILFLTMQEELAISMLRRHMEQPMAIAHMILMVNKLTKQVI